MATVMEKGHEPLSIGDVSEHISFLHLAHGSLGKLETQSDIWKDMGYLRGRDCQSLQGRIRKTRRMLSALIENLENGNHNG